MTGRLRKIELGAGHDPKLGPMNADTPLMFGPMNGGDGQSAGVVTS
jgi:hypothetical protein